jgi:putative membrane protein
MSDTGNPRRPRVFEAEEVEIAAPPGLADADLSAAAPEAEAARIPDGTERADGWRWVGLLLWSIGSLFVLSFGFWLNRLIGDLVIRQDWLGWTSITLVGLAGLALLVLLLRELMGLLRIRSLQQTRLLVAAALDHDDQGKARDALARIDRLYRDRDEMRWPLSRFRDEARNAVTTVEKLSVAERTLMPELDAKAREIIADAAKKVATITAISPFLVIDAIVILAQNARMLRRLATLYGARPGLAGIWRLAKLSIAQIAGTGLMEIAGDHLPTAALRTLGGFAGRKVGEGVFNAAMTARLGTTALDLCRPFPFRALTKPTPTGIIGRIAKEAGSATVGYVGGLRGSDSPRKSESP